MSVPPPFPSSAGTQDIGPLRSLIASSEDRLMHRVLDYAKQSNYVKYISLLDETWRISIAGFSSALLQVMDCGAGLPEPGPDEDFTKDPAVSLCIREAQKHRSLGVAIDRFLGLMKHYRRSYLALVQEADLDRETKDDYRLFIDRCFDRMELGFTSEWCAQARGSAASELKALEALRKSEESFRSLFENSRDAIMLLDRKGFFDCNKATLELFQCATKEEFTSRHPSELSPPLQLNGRESLAAAGERIEAAFAEGIQFFDWMHRRMDGSVFPAEVLLSRFELGERTVLQAVVRDITERRKADQSMRDSQHALQLKHAELNRVFTLVEAGKREWERTMDCVDDMVVLVDDKNRLKRCNKAFTQFAGRSYDRILGYNWPALMKEHAIDIGTSPTQGTELYHQSSNRWFTVSSYPVMDIGAERSSGLVITFHDSTARRTMNQQLLETNQKIEQNRAELRNALDELSSLIQKVAREKAFGIRFHNPNLIRCYDAKGCQKKSCPCHGKEAERCWQVVGTHCGGKVQGAFAQKYENCVDCSVFQSSTQNPVFQIGEHFNNMMSILELKNRELENAYNELKIAQGQVIQQEKMASIGQLAAGVAHEINNPTGFIMSNLGSLQKYVDRLAEFIRIQDEALKTAPAEDAEVVAKQRKVLKVDYIVDDLKSLVKESLDGTDRIKKIVQDLKNFSRVDEADMKMADINAGIESTINIVWNELKYKATLIKEYGDIPQIKCNPGQLNQVFMNLLVNSAHAIEKQGEIRVRTRVENDAINISISDTGSGIPKDKLGRIFEPFFTTKEVGKGTGLGLSIAYDIVKKHKGTISVESEVGKGTIFTVTMPIVEK